MNTSERKLLTAIQDNPDVSPGELVILVGLSRSTVQGGLRMLVRGGFVEKQGSSPQVRYRAVNGVSAVVQDSFIYRGVSGDLLFGTDGLRRWSEGRFEGKKFADIVYLYEDSFMAYQRKKEDELFFTMDASLKIPSSDIVFDTLRCLDLYTLRIGGETKRTKEAVLLEVAKGSGNPAKIKDLVHDYIVSSVKKINVVVGKEGVDGVAFIPPTAIRKVQIMRLLQTEFVNHNCHGADDVGIRRDFSDSNLLRQEQKHVASVKNRIINARNTYKVVRSGKSYKKLLLVDDLVGSGATVNEVARKFKESGVAEEVHCLCLVGINSKKLVVVRRA